MRAVLSVILLFFCGWLLLAVSFIVGFPFVMPAPMPDVGGFIAFLAIVVGLVIALFVAGILVSPRRRWGYCGGLMLTIVGGLSLSFTLSVYCMMASPEITTIMSPAQMSNMKNFALIAVPVGAVYLIFGVPLLLSCRDAKESGPQ